MLFIASYSNKLSHMVFENGVQPEELYENDLVGLLVRESTAVCSIFYVVLDSVLWTGISLLILKIDIKHGNLLSLFFMEGLTLPAQSEVMNEKGTTCA